MTYLLWFIALALPAWGVFGNHFTWAERRRELCKIGDHWMTTKPLIWHNKQGEYFSGTHCRACDFQKHVRIEK